MPQQPQQQGGGDNAYGPLWVALISFGVAYLLWQFARAYIVKGVFFFNILQARIVEFLLGDEVLSKQIAIMQSINPTTISWDEFVMLTTEVGLYTRFPFVVILGLMAVYVYGSNIKLKFKRVHDMKSLRAQEQQNWTSIMPVVKLDLAKTDINKGPWAMALTPIEFARKHNLLKKEDAILDNPIPGMEMTAGIRRGDAKRIFTLQLGPYFDGFNHCPPHVMALAAVFMARMNRDKDSAVEVLRALDKSVTEGKPNYAIAKPLLNKHIQSELVQEILGSHAYLLTVMASLLQGARDDGVVASAEFLWLKPVDRRLWYMLNCVGRQTPYAEVGGPFAHWRAEIALGRRSLVPMIDEAINALEIAVKEVKLSPKQLEELEP